MNKRLDSPKSENKQEKIEKEVNKLRDSAKNIYSKTVPEIVEEKQNKLNNEGM